MLQLAIFVSGRGSNFRAILNAIDTGMLDARVRLLVSSSMDAPALDLARSRAIPCHVAAGDDASETALLNALARENVDFIALCGYLKLVPPGVVQAFSGRMINIHPALLPAFGGKGMYGRRVHEAVLASGARISGATVHLVSEEYDKGPIVLQAHVEVLDEDTPESLAARVLEVEHRILPEALALFAASRIQIRNLRTIHLPPSR